MGINIIVNDVITELQSNITDLQIESFPDNSDEYKLIHPLGAILVAYNNSRFLMPQNEYEFIQQVERLEIGIVLIIKGLRDKNGAYSYIESIISTLRGFNPTGCTKMYPTSINFINERSGLWQYGITFNTSKEDITI